MKVRKPIAEAYKKHVNQSDRQFARLIVALTLLVAPATSRAFTPTEACPGKRMIGMLVVPSTSYVCPAVSLPWRKSKVFVATPPLTLPPELAAYCQYEWTDALNPPATGMLPASPDGRSADDWLRSDCNVVAPLGHPFGQSAAAGLKTAFDNQVETKNPLPLTGSPLPTKVVVVDSSVDTGFPYPGTGNSDHGELVGMTIRSIACPDPANSSSACLGKVMSRLAYPLRKDDSGAIVADEVNGGNFGSFRDLARAIFEGHQKAALAPGSPNILINISGGWDAEWGGTYPAGNWMTLDPPMRAVQSAISYAACRQALIIAAAGNKSGSPNEVLAPSFPGQWEKKAFPNGPRCTNLGSVPNVPSNPYRPLLYAAAGVAGDDVVLMNAKPNSIPRLVAPAANFAFVDDSGDGAYTGSSAAAAVLSGIAATVWGYLPNDSLHDVMDRIRNFGVPLPSVGVDFCLGTTCPASTTRASLCRAAESACSSSAFCPPATQWNCPTTGAGRDGRPSGLLFISPPPVTTIDLPESGWATATLGPPCNVDATYLTSPVDSCPLEQYYNQYGSPFSHSFPGASGCPTCPLRVSNNSLLMGIATETDGTTLTSPTLTIVFKDNLNVAKNYAIDVDPALLVGGATIEVKELPFDVTTVAKGTIQFVVNGDKASSDQLIIEP